MAGRVGRQQGLCLLVRLTGPVDEMLRGREGTMCSEEILDYCACSLLFWVVTSTAGRNPEARSHSTVHGCVNIVVGCKNGDQVHVGEGWGGPCGKRHALAVYKG